MLPLIGGMMILGDLYQLDTFDFCITLTLTLTPTLYNPNPVAMLQKRVLK